MPNMTYKQMIQRRARKHQFLRKCFKLDPDFKRYYQKKIDEVTNRVNELKRTEGGCNLLPCAYDPEYHVIMRYLQLPKGRALAKRLGLYAKPSIVRVSKTDGPARVLTLEIKLRHSRTEIKPALEHTLKYFKGRLLGKSRVSKVSPSPPIIHHYLGKAEVTRKKVTEEDCLYVEIDLRHHVKDILKVINPMLPRKPPTGPRFKQRRKVNPLAGC